MKKLSVFFVLGIITIMQSCSNSDAATVHEKEKEKKISDIKEDSTIHVLSSNLVTVYSEKSSCICGSTIDYKNIMTKIVIGKDTFVTVQKYNGDGVTMVKISK